ncbi:hypothetical protein MBLNU459_g8100t1 [Dothideomycetes sp. NU459]
MAVVSFVVIGGIAALIAFVYLTSRPTKTPKGLRRVPGPPGIPILGNTLQLKPQPQRQFQQWAREYGELFQIQMGYENWVFLNSPEAVKEILDKQSAVTSGRAPMPVASDLISGGMRFLLMGYTPEWRKLRTIVHKLLTPKVSDTFKPSQEFEAKQLIHDLYTNNQDEESFYMHQWDCEDVREVYGLMKDFSDHSKPGAHIADLIPPLANIPEVLQLWKKPALLLQKRQSTIWMKYWTSLKELVDQQKAPDCFVKQWMETDYQKQGISEIQAAFVAGTLIEAGSETTSASLNSCIKYLSANHAVQARAHEEISKVIGDSRSPTFDDEERLPYIRAMVKEILRIRPVTNIGTPHYTTADVIYKDFFIPKGTVVSIDQYAIHYDPARYDEPDEFKPERYLNHTLRAGAYTGGDPYARDHFGFGAGRRICPGMHLAENSLYITLAKILWAFEIHAPLGKDGKEEPVDVSDKAYDDGSNTLPKPFKARFIARNKDREQTLEREWQSALEEGYHLGNVKVDATGMVAI